jgi:hypothetical protein
VPAHPCTYEDKLPIPHAYSSSPGTLLISILSKTFPEVHQ